MYQKFWFKNKVVYIFLVIFGFFFIFPEANATFLHRSNLCQTIARSYSLTPTSPNTKIQKQIKILLEDKKYFYHVSQNSAPYLYYVYQQVQRKHMPAEIAFLPILESDYYPYCLSGPGAEGLWQMMRETAHDLHVPMNWWYEGRHDLFASTQGALLHLNYLHKEYKDWLIALAAYDAGEGPINRALRYNRKHHLPTDYWSLKLSKETEEYVPKLLALAEIIKYNRHYHVRLNHIPNAPAFTAIKIRKPINLQELAQLIHMDSMALLRLNPGFSRWITPLKGEYTLLVPNNKVALTLSELPKFSENNLWIHYKVKKSDSINSIAKNYKISVDDLEEINNISKHIKAKQIIRIPVDYSFIAAAKAPVYNLRYPRNKTSGWVKHIVSSHETLPVLASKYHTTCDNICAWNHISPSTLKSGKVLAIWQPSAINFDTHVRSHHQYRS